MTQRVAVVAVHGVGSPPPFQTARQVADLLGQHTRLADAAYAEFEERFIAVSTAPLVVAKDPNTPLQAATSADERLLKRARRFAPANRDRTRLGGATARALADEPDVEFMRSQLTGHTAPGPTSYDTIEIVGRRAGKGGEQTDVHIFEMNWADLSRVGSGIFRVIGALYQLLFHIAHLGRKSLDIPAEIAKKDETHVGDATAWRRAANAQAFVVRVFTLGIPIVSLLLLSFLILFVPAAVRDTWRLHIGAVLIGAVLATVVGVLMYFRNTSPKAAGQFFGVLALMIAALIAFDVHVVGLGHDRMVAVGSYTLHWTVTVLLALAYVAVLSRYDRSAPGALPWGLAALVVAILGVAVWGGRFGAGRPVAEMLRFTALAGFQVAYVLLVAVWLALWFASLRAIYRMFRVRAALRGKSDELRERARRATWTAQVTVTLSIFALLSAGLVAYEGVTIVGWRVHNTFNLFPQTQSLDYPLITNSLVPGWRCQPETVVSSPATAGQPPQLDPASCSHQFFERVIAETGTAAFPLAMIFVIVSLLMISWFVVLVAVTSVHTPESPGRYSVNVGNWMTQAFQWVRVAGLVLMGGLLLALFLGLVAAVWRVFSSAPTSCWLGFACMEPSRTLELIKWFAGVVLASAATFGAARLRVEMVAAKARPALGIILDVDNYLRESPEAGTPRALIAERYTSLLRHIVNRKDAHGVRFFDRVVIVSHSQGTVISADLLRFLSLTNVADPDLSVVDVRLMTMGSPLRQLYAANFPYLYRWINRSDDFTTAPDTHARRADDTDALARVPRAPALAAATSGALDGLSPSPRWLRVSKWVNLYTAGDYVGRTLWQTEYDPDVWRYQPRGAGKSGVGRYERCLGDGTHTRYWSMAEVAAEIDALLLDDAGAPASPQSTYSATQQTPTTRHR